MPAMWRPARWHQCAAVLLMVAMPGCGGFPREEAERELARVGEYREQSGEAILSAERDDEELRLTVLDSALARRSAEAQHAYARSLARGAGAFFTGHSRTKGVFVDRPPEEAGVHRSRSYTFDAVVEQRDQDL